MLRIFRSRYGNITGSHLSNRHLFRSVKSSNYTKILRFSILCWYDATWDWFCPCDGNVHHAERTLASWRWHRNLTGGSHSMTVSQMQEKCSSLNLLNCLGKGPNYLSTTSTLSNIYRALSWDIFGPIDVGWSRLSLPACPSLESSHLPWRETEENKTPWSILEKYKFI